MGLMSRFTDLFKDEEQYTEDDYDNNYEEEEQPVPQQPVQQQQPQQQFYSQPQPINTTRSSGIGSGIGSAALEMKVVKPDKFEAVTQIGEHLLARRTVVLNLEETNKETVRRIIDFLTGVAFAIEGHIKRVSNSTYVITPKNVDVSGEQQSDDDRVQRKLF